MATNLISFPFRLDPSGAVATRDSGSPDYLAEQLAVLCLTRPGERALVPNFGLTDPTFSDFDRTELEAKVQVFGPPVQITGTEVFWPRADRQEVSINFQSLSEVEDAPSYESFGSVLDQGGFTDAIS